MAVLGSRMWEGNTGLMILFILFAFLGVDAFLENLKPPPKGLKTCDFTCPAGTVAKPNPDHTPSANGCGIPGMPAI